MPRIDPEKLLTTLAPLLDSDTGAIKSKHEVDKIYGLMSKFSKKLVSKCTYINILTSTPKDLLDLFLQRGGWDMVLSWTENAVKKQNYNLLKEICGLLLHSPATVQRLKENELPKVIKSLSKDCEDEEIREIAKKVVMKWIAIAKSQSLVSNSFPLNNMLTTIPKNPDSGNAPFPVQSCSITSTDSAKLPQPTTNNAGKESEHHTTGDLDIAHFDISDITQVDLNEMNDFNPEHFSKVVDQHLGDISEAVANGSAIVHSVDNANVVVDSSETIKIQLDSNHEALKQPTKLLIKTIGGHKTVVHGLNGPVSSPTKTENNPYCIVMKAGKPFLVRLKRASPNDLPSGQSSGSFPKKTSTDEKHVPAILSKCIRTYSRKDSVVMSSSTNDTQDTEKAKSPAKTSTKSSEGSTNKSKSSSKSGSAAAAKKLAEDNKLKEKIKQQKIALKKRSKEAAKQKQQVEKDQETLKTLNLTKEPSVTQPPNKIPKIPKRQASFADAIGIPGTSEQERTIKKKNSIDEKDKASNELNASLTKTSKNEPNDKEKERRHRVKVFTSKSSRADDLLKDLTETVKLNKSNKSNTKPDTGEKSLVGNSLIFKPEKRPSIDGMEKPGDSKKAKISDDTEKKKDRIALANKEKKSPSTIKECSMFMDALNASTETQKVAAANKRKRRLSSANEKDKESLPNKTNKSPLTQKSSTQSPQDSSSNPRTPPINAAKPAFNFYRETLDDDEIEILSTISAPTKTSEQMDILTGDAKEVSDDDDSIEAAFIPTAEEFVLKSALVIHRARNKPKKSVKWREETQLTETFHFEMDEEERVNVTRHKDFMAMKEQEKAEGKEFVNLKHRMMHDEMDDRMSWRKPPILFLNMEPPVIESREKITQEERERLNLGVFLPPGSILPDTPSEPDPASPNQEEQFETKNIPLDDVINVTKVFDNRMVTWPKPDPSHLPSVGRTAHPATIASRLGEINMAAGHIPSLLSFPNPQPQHVGFENPWNVVAPTPSNSAIGMRLFNISEMGATTGVNTPQLPHAGAIGYPPPPSTNPFGFPIPPSNPTGLAATFQQAAHFSQLPNPITLATATNSFGRDNRTGLLTAPRTGGRGNDRDFGDRDFRRPHRDQDSRQRDSHESRSRSSRNDYRSRDRDRRSPSPPRRRREEREDRDYRDHDYRSRQRTERSSGGKRDIPCRYFSKGHCINGTRCEFSHEVANQDKPSSSSSSRQDSLSKNSGNGRRSSPSESWENDNDSINNQFERRPSVDNNNRNYADTPSSPNANDGMEDATYPPIIPVE